MSRRFAELETLYDQSHPVDLPESVSLVYKSERKKTRMFKVLKRKITAGKELEVTRACRKSARRLQGSSDIHRLITACAKVSVYRNMADEGEKSEVCVRPLSWRLQQQHCCVCFSLLFVWPFVSPLLGIPARTLTRQLTN